MKRKTVGAATFAAAGLVALRRFGPSLHQRAMGRCQEMFVRMAQGLPIDGTPGDSPGALSSIPCDPAGCRPGRASVQEQGVEIGADRSTETR